MAPSFATTMANDDDDDDVRKIMNASRADCLDKLTSSNAGGATNFRQTQIVGAITVSPESPPTAAQCLSRIDFKQPG